MTKHTNDPRPFSHLFWGQKTSIKNTSSGEKREEHYHKETRKRRWKFSSSSFFLVSYKNIIICEQFRSFISNSEREWKAFRFVCVASRGIKNAKNSARMEILKRFFCYHKKNLDWGKVVEKKWNLSWFGVSLRRTKTTFLPRYMNLPFRSPYHWWGIVESAFNASDIVRHKPTGKNAPKRRRKSFFYANSFKTLNIQWSNGGCFENNFSRSFALLAFAAQRREGDKWKCKFENWFS